MLESLLAVTASGGHWLADLVQGRSPASIPLALAACVGLGAALGHLRVLGVSLGITMALFAGILWSWLCWEPQVVDAHRETLTFIREFGLVLFVYCLGMQVGRSFVESLRATGLRWNLVAVGVVCGGLATAAGISLVAHHLLGQGWAAPQAMVGAMSGAVTNTPGLSAAGEALHGLAAQGWPADLAAQASVAYAVAYPCGVAAIIIALAGLRAGFRIDPAAECRAWLAERGSLRSGPTCRSLRVDHATAAGRSVADLAALGGPSVVVSRLGRDGGVSVPIGATRVAVGDILHAVGEPADLERLRLLVGDDAPVDLRAAPGPVGAREVVVTDHAVIGVPLARLDLPNTCGGTITRIMRDGRELPAAHDAELQFGDRVHAVGDPKALERLAHELGGSEHALRKPQILALFLGIAAGVVLGQVPIPVPGLPAPVKLGMAGGPLVAALVLARIGHIGRHVNFFIAKSANNLLREFGIALFLACVGLLAGGRFVDALLSADGACWILSALAITLVPLLVAGVFARLVLRMNWVPLSGIMAGSHTDPPALAFACQQAGDESPATAYAAVYPLAMLLRIVGAQVFVLALVPWFVPRP